MRLRATGTRTDQRGQIIVLFALLLPVILTIGSIVVSAGNWFVLKRHLQTQVDAAALAGGPAFTGCSQDPATTNVNITQQALRFAGDTARYSTPFNLQLQQAGDQRIVVNSAAYWSPGDPTDGSSLDNTLGLPCDAKFLDVKATDEDAPLLFRWLPLFPDLKTRARVEISRVVATEGIRPLGVPEVDPTQVAVIFVDENGDPDSANSVRGKSFLDLQPTPPTGLEGMSVWSRDAIQPVGINGNDNFGVVIVASRSPNPIDLNGTLDDICNQNPTQTTCYAGDQLDDGVSFIHGYATTGTGTANNPLVRDVSLGGGCTGDLSRPYFNVTGGCPIGISATIDFGTGATDPRLPVASGGVCAEVSATPGGNLAWSGGVWTGAFTPDDTDDGGGPNPVNLRTETDTTGGCNGGNNPADNFTKVASAYVASEESGPIQYLTVEISGGGLANSMIKDSNSSLDVVVGIQPPLRDGALTDPPITLRIGNPPNSQALRCDGNGTPAFEAGMEFGCVTPYQIYDETKHVSLCGPPPPGTPAANPEDCIRSEPGNFQQSIIRDMWGSPCSATPNNWNGVTLPPSSDPRWIPLFIMDEKAFVTPSEKWYPIRRFGMFYVTAGSGLNCPGDNPNPVPGTHRSIWGHFSSYVTPGFGSTVPSDVECSFTDGELCVSNLVE